MENNIDQHEEGEAYLQPPPVGGEQDIEKHIGQTIYEINQRNSKVIGYLSTTTPQPSTPPPGENKPFIVANVREIFDNEETSYSRKVELLNEVAAKFYQPSTQQESGEGLEQQISKILVNNKYRLDTRPDDTAVFVVDIPKVSKILAGLFATPSRTDSEAVELTREQVEAIWDASHERFINSIFLTNKTKKQ